jgi:hypothetical protein
MDEQEDVGRYLRVEEEDLEEHLLGCGKLELE